MQIRFPSFDFQLSRDESEPHAESDAEADAEMLRLRF